MTDIEKIRKVIKEMKTICNEECGIKPEKCTDCDCRFAQIYDILTKDGAV